MIVDGAGGGRVADSRGESATGLVVSEPGNPLGSSKTVKA